MSMTGVLKGAMSRYFRQVCLYTQTIQATKKCGWSKLDKFEKEWEMVNLKNDGPTFFKFKSICMKQVVNNA